MNRTDVAKWLEQEFLSWQAQQGESKTVTEFAKFLGVSRNTLNNWLNRGQNPEGDNIGLIASRLGPGIYDAMGIPRPDPDLQVVISSWGAVPKGARRRLAEEAAVYSAPGGERREKVAGMTKADLDRLVAAGKVPPMLAALLKNWETLPMDVKEEILGLLEKAKKRKRAQSKAE